MTTSQPLQALTQRLPAAPEEYDQKYMDALTRRIEMVFRLVANPGPLNGSSLSLSNIQVGGYNLRVGDIYSDENGFLKIIRQGDAHTQGVSSSANVGTVSVTIT